MQSKASNGQTSQANKIGAGAVTAELEETKQTLQKAREDSNLMAHCLTSLRQELEHTRRELHQLRYSRSNTHNDTRRLDDDPEIEEIKFVENPMKFVEAIKAPEKGGGDGFEVLEKKRSVKFANPPLLTKVMVSKDGGDGQGMGMGKGLDSSKKAKKKPLVPLFGGLFMKRKGSKE